MWAMCGADCAVQCTVDDESRWLNITLQYITNYIVWSRLHGTVLWMMKADVSIFSNTVLYMIMFFVFLKYCTAHEHVFLYIVCFRYVVQYSARDDESRCLNIQKCSSRTLCSAVWCYTSWWQKSHYSETRSLGALRAPTSSWRPIRPLDFVLPALRALRPCDPRVADWIVC